MSTYADLVDAVAESRRGGRVDFRAPQLRAGGSMVTESFLSPFRFNLGPPLVRRPTIPSLRVFVPDPLICVGDDVGAGSPAVRAFLAGGETDDLVVVEGGNGLASACLVDELIAAGSTVVEGLGPVDTDVAHHDGVGVARLFIGLRSAAPLGPAFATAVGAEDEATLLRGDVSQAVGFVVSNAHLDANLVDPSLASFVWQAALPFGAEVSRADYTRLVLEALDLDPAVVVFKLLWLPEDTGERLPTDRKER